MFAQVQGQQTKSMVERSPAGQKTIRFIKAVNDKMEVDSSFESNFSSDGLKMMGDITKTINSISKKHGKLSVYSIYRPSYFIYEYKVNCEKTGWKLLKFDMLDQSPYGIIDYSISSIEKPDKIGEEIKF